jgi:hypothetical protein
MGPLKKAQLYQCRVLHRLQREQRGLGEGERKMNMIYREMGNEHTARHEFSEKSNGFSSHAFSCDKETDPSPGLTVYFH